MVIREENIADAIVHDRARWLNIFGRIPVEQDVLWTNVPERHTRFFLYKAYENNKVRGFVLVKIRRGILAEMNFGPVVDDAIYYVPFIKLVLQELRKKRVWVVRIISPSFEDSSHEIKSCASHFNWATVIIDLANDIDTVFRSFNDNHKYSIRKTLSQGVKVTLLGEEDLPVFLTAYIAMFQRRGIDKDVSEARLKFTGIFQTLQTYAGEGMVLGVRHPETGALVAGGVFIKSGDTMYYRDGFSEKIKGWALLHVIIWEAVRIAKELGCLYFDLGGYSLKDDSQLQAINDFKRWFSRNIRISPPTKIIELFPFAARLLKVFGKSL